MDRGITLEFNVRGVTGGQYAQDRVHKQPALSNSTARQIDQTVLQEQFLWEMVHAFNHFFLKLKIQNFFFPFFVVISRFFWIFENFVIKFNHEKALNQMN